MTERPIIFFQKPKRADRNKGHGFSCKINKPSFSDQYDRLAPKFEVLQEALKKKELKLQQSTSGIKPEFALVFEVVGTKENFYTAVKNCDGLEWMFETASLGISPDENFSYITKDNKEDKEKVIEGKIYCVMTNQQAIKELLSLWKKYKNGDEKAFKKGFTGLRDVFYYLKDVHKWNAKDRIEETGILENWKKSLAIDGNEFTNFEIELFYRNSEINQKNSEELVKSQIEEMQGKVLSRVLIKEIAYHSLLVQLPRNEIRKIVNNYANIKLVTIDNIMFFRPVCQSTFSVIFDNEKMKKLPTLTNIKENFPVAAMFDGMPIQNHPILKDRLIIDDPDDFENQYESKYRCHGTAMASLIIYGDLNYGDCPIKSPLYVRPILRPKEVANQKYFEEVPNDKIMVDIIHRAVLRMVKKNGSAPTVKIINLSVCDPARQLSATMSPLARLLDYLSFTYKILFIVSAGNHPEIFKSFNINFSEFKKKLIQEKNNYIFKIIKENQRNLKLLSPAESINCLTVGAIYSDGSKLIENSNLTEVVQEGLPSPISAFGKGYNSIITPDLFYYGGRKQIRENLKNGKLTWAETNKEPGCKVAAPYINGTEDGQSYTWGTSDAAAQVTHAGVKCNEILTELFKENNEKIPEEYNAIMLKAMLTHGATWGKIDSQLVSDLKENCNRLSEWLGNGIPDISKVQECTTKRITLIGFNKIKDGEGNLFILPLPLDFSSKKIKRKLTVTLAYFTPIEARRQAYRTIKLWFDIEKGKDLFKNRNNTDWNAVRKGTLQHEIFEGDSYEVLNNNEIVIKVNCQKDAAKYDNSIPYCLFVTFEIGESQETDLYSIVNNKIKEKQIEQVTPIKLNI